MTFLAATAVFLALHWLVARLVRSRFRYNLKLSRGVAGVALVAVGVASWVEWWPLAGRAFLAVHPDRGDAWALEVLAGHLVADLAWFVGGRLLLGSRTARDLVLHHLLGLAACAAAWLLGTGYAVVGVILVSEVLPVLTGLGALAKIVESSRLELFVLRASLAVVAAFRIPLWLVLGALLAARLAGPGYPETAAAVPWIMATGLALVVALDLTWCRAYLRLLAQFAASGRAHVPVDPLAPITAPAALATDPDDAG